MSEGEGSSSGREKESFEFTVRTLVEKKFVVESRSRFEAELLFEKMKMTGQVEVEGVVQSTSCRSLGRPQIDPKLFEVLEQTRGPGQPTFYTVIHRESGLRKTKTSLEEAYNKVKSDLSRRTSNGHHIETLTHSP